MNKVLKWGLGCGCGPIVAIFAAAVIIAFIEVIFDVNIISDDEPEQNTTAAVDSVENANGLAADTSASTKTMAAGIAASTTTDSAKKVVVVPHAPGEPYTMKSIPNTRLRGNGIHVSDPDNIIGKEYTDSINLVLSGVRDSADIFVVAVDRVDNPDGDEFTHLLFNYWGIGDKDKDNGVLVFMTMKPHFIRIETGYGMEGTLPDVTCKRILRHKVTPLFRQDRYPEGTLECAKALAAIVSPDSTGMKAALFANMDAIEKEEAHQRELREQQEKEEEEKGKRMMLWGLGIIGLIISFFVIKDELQSWKNASRISGINPDMSTSEINERLYKESRVYKKYPENEWWVYLLVPLALISYLIVKFQSNKLIKRPRICPHCGKPMRLLSEAEEDAYLSEAQQNEERYKSKNYDVWVCNDCEATLIEDYESDSTNYYTACPHCHAKLAKIASTVEVLKPTIYKEGEEKTTFVCLNCGKKFNKRYSIPKLKRYTSSSSYGSSSYSSSSSSSYRSSSYSSSSSSSSGSFGGGRSGGGGASSSW